MLPGTPATTPQPPGHRPARSRHGVSRWPTAIALSLGLVSVGASATASRQPVELAAAEIASGLHLIAGAGGNIVARVTTGGVVLVDSGRRGDQASIATGLHAMTDQPVVYVINTHHHQDHTGGNGGFSGTATLIAHAAAHVRIVAAGESVPPSVVFSTTTSVFVDGVEVRARHLGHGHTDGDVVVEFPDLRVVHAGDLVTAGAPIIDYDGGGSLSGWIATLGRLLRLDFETAVPGHGTPMTRTDVQEFRDRLVTLRARVAQLVQNGVAREAVADRLVTTDLGWARDPGSRFWSHSVPGVYAELVDAFEDDEPGDDVVTDAGTTPPAP